jgi:hypothetical protein
VIAVSPPTLSGFRLRPPAGAIQEDSLKARIFVLVSATAGALEPCSASFPGIEVRRWLLMPVEGDRGVVEVCSAVAPAATSCPLKRHGY